MGIKTKYLLLLLLAGASLFLFNLGARDLWEPDETRYAVVAREMRESGNWILPHLNGKIYAEKPPLFFWLVNLSTFLFGENSEFTNRLPSALAGLMTVIVTFLFGGKLFNLRVGFLSAMVLATSALFPQLSRWMMLDSLFTLLFLLTLFYFYLGFENEEKRRKYYLVAGFFIGLGVLTKGPIAFLVIPIFVIFAFSQKKVKAFWNVYLLWGTLLSFLVIFLWLLPACWIGGEDYTKRILFGQTVGRLAGEEKSFHPEPFYFYFIRFPIDFFPWIVFLPSAILLGFRKGEEIRKKFLFLLIWFLWIFFFFTLSKGKKDNYLLPLYPAAAILIGFFWDSGLRSSEGKWGAISGLIFLALLFSMGSLLFFIGIPEKLYPILAPFHSLVLWVLLYLFLGSFLSFLSFLKNKRVLSFIILAITFGLFQLHLSFLLPKFNSQRSMKAFSERILKRVGPEDELKIFSNRYHGLLYYTQKPYIEQVESMNRLSEILQSPQRVFVVIPLKYLNRIKKGLNMEVEPIEQTKIGSQDLGLIQIK